MNKVTGITICVVVFFIGLMLSDYYKHTESSSVRAVQVQMVQQVCDIAHGEVSGYSEEACGNVQDQTNTEYICNSTSCWVEQL